MAKNPVTAQYPDKIIYEGTAYDLNSNPLEPYFDKHPEKKPPMSSTALWRGYVAYFEIIDGELFVTDMKRPVGYEDEDGSYKQKWISIYHTIFPPLEKVKIDWYSGILILPHGKLIDYVHMGYASTYSKYWLLEIEKGNFNEARKYKYKQYVKFKQRQFEAFRKTDAYKKLYTELKETEGVDGNDDEFLRSFISNFVINYTSKFLTD